MPSCKSRTKQSPRKNHDFVNFEKEPFLFQEKVVVPTIHCFFQGRAVRRVAIPVDGKFNDDDSMTDDFRSHLFLGRE